jgi:protein-S-isoprenylcysteine O-methyltransferase Ste14
MTTLPLRLHPRISDRLLPGFLFSLWAILILVAAEADTPLEIGRKLGSVAFTGLAGYLFVMRAPRRGQRASVVGGTVALAGSFIPLALTLAPPQSNQLLVAIGTSMTVVGLALSVYALAALGRCFGLFPEARGLVTRGPYQLVRHPLYMAEFIVVGGIVVSSLSAIAVVFYLALVALQVWRALNEERALMTVFPEYEAYRATTARFVPFAW